MGKTLSGACLCVLICLIAGAAPAQMPISFTWSEQINLAQDSGGALLDANSSAMVVWDKDDSGLAGWSPLDPLPTGDEAVLDFSDMTMSEPFGGGAFAGQFLGNWTADDNDAWTTNGESLYLLAHVPAAFSSSGLDEYGVSSLVAITGWPNKGISHDIVGGGPIQTAPVPEPATVVLVTVGLGLASLRRKR